MFFVLGGHWAVFQSIAWSKMLYTYTQDSGSFIEAVGKTFDGLHPCKMCISITDSQDDEEQMLFGAEKKVDAFTLSDSILAEALEFRKFSYPVNADARFTSLTVEPTPPVPLAA